MRKSVLEYIPIIFHYWWVIGISIIPTAIMAGFDIADTTQIVVVTLSVTVIRVIWVIGLVCTLLIAPFLAFHKIRQERDNIQHVLDGINTNRQVVDNLGVLFSNGNRLIRQKIESEDDYDGWVSKAGGWLDEGIQEIQKLSMAEVELFRQIAGRAAIDFTGSFNNEHNQKRAALKAHVDNLRDIIGRYAINS